MKDKYLKQAEDIHNNISLKQNESTYENSLDIIADLLREIDEYQDNIKEHCRHIIELERERDELKECLLDAHIYHNSFNRTAEILGYNTKQLREAINERTRKTNP